MRSEDDGEPNVVITMPDGTQVSVKDAFSSVSVRSGPDANIYPSVGFLYAGDAVPIIARTARGNWYLIQTEEGSKGWIAASVVDTEEISNLEAIPTAVTIPPTPQIRTATPTPTVPAPVATAPPSENAPRKKKDKKEPTKQPTRGNLLLMPKGPIPIGPKVTAPPAMAPLNPGAGATPKPN
jgi:uncharacterized protein YraI